jgi:hypothetical protein
VIGRTTAAVWLLTASLVGTALGAVGVGLGTNVGRDVLTRYGVALLNEVVNGSATVGAVTGNLTDGFEARDVVIRGEDDVVLARLPEVHLRYRVLDLLTRRITLGRVVLVEPQINLVRHPGGRFNFEDVLGLGGTGGDGGGRKPLVAFRDVQIRDGTVVIRTPTDAPADAPNTEASPAGPMHVRRVDGLNAGLSYAQLSSPFEGEKGLRFDLADLSGRLSEPALDIRALKGEVRIEGDSMALDLSRLVLPESETAVSGALTWPNGPLLFALDLDARRLAVNDARPFVDGLPWGLAGSGRMSLRSLDADRIRVDISPLQLAAPGGGGSVAGRFGITVDQRAGWTLRDTDLRLDTLELDYLRPMVDTIPFAGRVSGDLQVSGPSDSLEAQLQLWFQDQAVASMPRSHLRGSGILGLADGIRFSGFWVDSSDIALATVQRLVPAVELQGELALRGWLEGPWHDVSFDGVIRHRDGGLPASVARGPVHLDTRRDTVGMWADLTLDSLNFAGIHRSYPGVPKRGVLGGEVQLGGYADSLSLAADLRGAPGRIAGRGTLALLPGRSAVTGLDVAFQRLDVNALDFTSPPSELYGEVSGNLVSRRGSGLQGSLTLALDTSFVAATPLDGLSGTVRFADSMIRLDSVELRGPSWRAVADGRFGLVASQEGTLALRVSVDSLAAIASLLRNRLPSLDRDSLLDELSGVVRADVELTGSVAGYRTAAEVEVPVATSARALLEGLGLRVSWPATADGPVVIDGTLDSLALDRFSYSDLALSASGRRTASQWSARARMGLYGSLWARGETEIDSTGATRVPIDSLGLLLPTHRWFLAPGAVLTLRDTGYEFTDVALASEDGRARLSLQGQLPRGGSMGEIVADLVGVPLADAWGLLQLDTAGVGGRVGGTVLLSGAATDPVWRVSVQWTDGRFSVPIPMTLEATANYADRRLTGNGAGYRFGERVLSLDFNLPLDLALEGASQRQLPGELSINAVGDGIDLSLLALATPSVSNARGQLDLDVGIAGSWVEPRLRGAAEITDGGAYLSGLGVTYEDVDARFALSGDTIAVTDLTIQSGEGRAEFDGHVRLEELTRPVLDLAVSTSRFPLMDVPQVLALTTSGTFWLQGPAYGATLTGRGTVTKGDLYFADLIEKQIINLEDTLYASLIDPDLIREAGLETTLENRLLDSLRIDSLSLQMGSDVRLLSNEADIQLTGQLLVGKVADRYRIDGTLSTPRGTYRLPFGRGAVGLAELVVREFDVTGGQVQYFGTPDLNADIDINARYVVRTTKEQDITVFVNVGGTLYSPVLTLSSDVRPELPEDEIISYLLFNAPTVEIGAVPSELLGALSTEVVSPFITGLGLPLDYFRIRPPSQGLSGTEIALGVQLSQNTFITLSPRICQEQQRGRLASDLGASFEYRFSPNWHFAFSRDPVNACTLAGAASRQFRSQIGWDLFWEKRY